MDKCGNSRYLMFLTPLMTLLLNACSPNDRGEALGTLERDRILLKATAAEIIIAEPVREGTLVKKGQLLVQLDDTQAKAQVARARAALAAAQANQAKLRHGARSEDIAASKAQVESAQARATQTASEFDRLAPLARQKMIGQSELDAARSARDAARGDLERSRQGLLSLTNGTRIEDLQAADAQVAEAEAALALEQSRLNQLSLIATRDGVLDRLPKYVGERANIGDPLALILAGSAPFARVYIIETARAKLQVGQTLTVHVDGQPQAFTGRLRWVSQDPAFTPYYALNAQDRALLMYLAEIDLPDSARDLPSGLPVQVDISDDKISKGQTAQ